MTQANAAVAALPTTELRVLPPPEPEPPAIKKLSFGKIATAKAETATAYPVFPDTNGQAAIIAARLIQRVQDFDALEGAIKTDKAELRLMTTPHYFQTNHGRHDVPSSIAVNSPKGEVLVTFQNRYSTKMETEAPVQAVIGAQRTAKYFSQAFDFKIAGDKLPTENAQAFIDELQELLASYGCTEALEVKACIRPNSEFHAARHLELTNEENIALDQACPIIAMIKTKGRKK